MATKPDSNAVVRIYNTTYTDMKQREEKVEDILKFFFFWLNSLTKARERFGPPNGM